MIEAVVALLMFVNGEIKEHRIQENMAGCLRGKRHAERNYRYWLNNNEGYKTFTVAMDWRPDDVSYDV